MNTAAGDREVTIGGKVYHLRPDYKAFEKIEALCEGALCGAVSKLWRKCLSGAHDGYAGLGLRDTTVILFACMQSGSTAKTAPNFQELGSMLLKEGYRKFDLVCFELLKVAFPPQERAEESGGTEKKTTMETAGESTTSSASPSPAST